MNNAQILRDGIAELGLEIAEPVQVKLLSYVELLHKWNKVFNLTAVRDKQEMVSYHLLDSLAVLPHLWAGRWLDVGCGGGMPGVILAITRPDWHFTLLDSNTKKTGFVQQAVIELGLRNVSVHSGRVEEWDPAVLFDGIISRAFAELGDFVRVSRHLIAIDGHWVAMKGLVEAELNQIPAGCEIEKVISLKVPGIDAARSLVIAKVSGGQSA
ncbi:MAG: 16S rRNA (guanine(527)-N(7))-methyltransferase RsmG [Sideroxydans sp.]|nr:16S rRNA (guanine(527)-N(7))-methyltransferase RsmG [Sideroxydans sp.]